MIPGSMVAGKLGGSSLLPVQASAGPAAGGFLWPKAPGPREQRKEEGEAGSGAGNGFRLGDAQRTAFIARRDKMSHKRESTVSRRQFLSLAAAAAAGGALAACAPKAAPSKPAEGEKPVATQVPEPAAKTPLKLTYWVFWSQYGDLLDQFRKTEELAAALNGNEVDMQVGVTQEVFLTNISAGTPPDVAATSYYVKYMSRDVLLPIEDLVAKSSLVKPDAYIKSNWDVCSYKGVQYGVPANEGFVRLGLNYNSKLVTEAGLDPDNPPATWPELFEWHKKLTKFDNAGNVKQIGLDPFDAIGGSAGGVDGFFAAESWGFDWFNPETGEFNFDHEKMAEAFETMGEFIKFVGPDNLTALRNVEGQGTWGGSFNSEVQAMIIEGYWHAGETMHEKPEVGQYNRCSWVPVPESRRGTKAQYGDGHMVLFFKNAKHPAEAFCIAEFLQTNAACDIIFKTIGWLPSLTSYLETVDTSVFPGIDFYVKSVKEANYWGKIIQCDIEEYVYTKYAEMYEAVYRGQMTGAQAAKELQAACEQEWKEGGHAG